MRGTPGTSRDRIAALGLVGGAFGLAGTFAGTAR